VIPAFVVGKITQENADLLLAETKCVNDGSLHVFFSDQRPHYPEAILNAFGHQVQPPRQGSRGRFPKKRKAPPEGLVYAQVVKHRQGGRVTRVTYRVIFGTDEQVQAYLERSSISRQINISFVERQNGTMRHHTRRCTRKTIAFSKKTIALEQQLWLGAGYYHFCLPHGGLREALMPPLPTKGTGSPKKWRPVTPAMSVEVTDHVWSLQELLTFRTPPNLIINSII